MNIGIVGGGPAGLMAAWLLRLRGHSVTVFDPLVPWEKPCAGGLTAKTLQGRSVLDSLPRNPIERVSLAFGNLPNAEFVPETEIVSSAREALAAHLLLRAEESGVEVRRGRITKIERIGGGRWRLHSGLGAFESDIVIGADGATSFVRKNLGTPLGAEDLAVSVGYFIPAVAPGLFRISFVPDLRGFVWCVPRKDHFSYGLLTRSAPAWNVRAKQLLENYIAADLGIEVLQQARYFSATVPCLRPKTWRRNIISGDGWALVGDAGGFCDPITAEGIPYALRSAEILADSIENLSDYPRRIASDFGKELVRASRLYGTFYGRAAWRPLHRRRIVQLARKSRTLRLLIGDLFSGRLRYTELRKRLLLASPAIAIDCLRPQRNQ